MESNTDDVSAHSGSVKRGMCHVPLLVAKAEAFHCSVHETSSKDVTDKVVES